MHGMKIKNPRKALKIPIIVKLWAGSMLPGLNLERFFMERR